MKHELILHHYWHSPFSRRARLFLALKNLPWHSVEMPNAMPKPELTRLTGGYRRAPVLQIGADIYCDSRMILRELDRRFPDACPTSAGDEQGIAYWLDRACFVPTVSLLFGGLRQVLPPEFVRDREALFAGQSFSVDQASKSLPELTDRWRSLVGTFSEWLGPTKPYLRGSTPGVLDAACCMYVSMIRSWLPAVAGPVLEEYPRVAAWSERMEAIGEGVHQPMSHENSLAIARETVPVRSHIDPGLGLDHGAPNVVATVAADDYGMEPARGALVCCDAYEIVIRRADADLGDICVHFPSTGYRLSFEKVNEKIGG